MTPGRVTAVIPAAGRGTRLAAAVPKAFVSLSGVPMLLHTLRLFEHAAEVDHIVLVVPPGRETSCRRLIAPFALTKVVRVVAGGATRQASVSRGLQVVPRGTEIVVVHDGARPFVTERLIAETVREARRRGAAMAALPIQDTVKTVGPGRIVETTVDRNGLWAAQTPQAFRLGLLREVHQRARRAGVIRTDDAALIEWAGHRIAVVPGSPINLKITSRDDFVLAERLLQGQMRVGLGYDIHPLRAGRRLILGGVRIPFAKGLSGHSDADVLLHALTDALLGALGHGDLGVHYPPTDRRWKGASSLRLLAGVVSRMGGARLVHADCIVIAERPRLAPHIPAMRRRIAEVLGVPKMAINIKVKTAEGLGALGRGEGMAAQAVCTVSVPDLDEPGAARRHGRA